MATQSIPRTISIVVTVDETFDVGMDTGTTIDDRDYTLPFAFSGKLSNVKVKLAPPFLSPDDLKKLEAGAMAGQDAK